VHINIYNSTYTEVKQNTNRLRLPAPAGRGRLFRHERIRYNSLYYTFIQILYANSTLLFPLFVYIILLSRVLRTCNKIITTVIIEKILILYARILSHIKHICTAWTRVSKI